MKKALSIIFTTMLLVLALTGCVQSDIGVKLNKNGTGSVAYTLGIKEDFYNQLKSSGDDPFEGKETKKYKDGDDTYISCSESKDYSSYEEIQKSLLDLTYETELFEDQESDVQEEKDIAEVNTVTTKDNHIFKSVNIEKKSGIFYSVYSFNAVLNPQEKEQNGQNINDLYKLTLSVEMPEKITQSQNGEAKENKITFEINDISEATEYAAASETNHIGVIIGILVVILAVAVTFVIITKKKN